MASPSLYDYNCLMTSYTPQADLTQVSNRLSYYGCDSTVSRKATVKKIRPAPYTQGENLRTTIVHSATIKNEFVPGQQDVGNQSRTAVLHNLKERRRNHALNEAFETLKNQIPVVSSDTKLSKIKTLRVATAYINYLNSLLDSPQAPSSMTDLMTVVSEEINRKNSYTERVTVEQQYTMERSNVSNSQFYPNSSVGSAQFSPNSNGHQISPVMPLSNSNNFQYNQPTYQYSPDLYNYNSQYGYGPLL